MSTKNSSLMCLAGGWGFAFLAATLAAIMLMLIGDWRIIQASFAWFVIFIIVGALISWIACRPLPAPGEATFKPQTREHPVPTSAQSAAAAAEKAKAGATAPAPEETKTPSAPAVAAAAAKSGVVPSRALPGTAELAERKGTWRYEGGAASAATKPAAAPAAAATTPAPAKDEAKPEAAAAKPDAAAAGAEAKPEGLSAARDGGPDDLKLIKGVGPKLEKLLHSMGFFHFDQIANWRAAEVAWVDENLEGFKGRVTRDEWVTQAKVLAKGGSTEFSKKAGKGDVY